MSDLDDLVAALILGDEDETVPLDIVTAMAQAGTSSRLGKPIQRMDTRRTNTQRPPRQTTTRRIRQHSHHLGQDRRRCMDHHRRTVLPLRMDTTKGQHRA